jgi:hypothetical protein
MRQICFITPLEYSHSDGIAIIGGFVDRGPGVPALDGLYVFGDFAGIDGVGRLFYSDFSNGLIQELQIGSPARSLGFQLKVLDGMMRAKSTLSAMAATVASWPGSFRLAGRKYWSSYVFVAGQTAARW